MRYLIVLLLSFLILIPSDGFSQITDVVYAIGNNDTMLKLVDGYWVPIVLDPGVFCGSLQEIWGSSSEDIYITGCDPGAVLHYDGISWQLLHVPDATLPIPDALMTVDGTGPDDIYVGGYECTGPEMDGVAYHWNGTDWTYIGGSGGIRRIWVDPGGGLYAITYKFDDVPVGGVYYYLLERYIDGGWSTVLSAPYEYFGCVGAFYNVSGMVIWVQEESYTRKTWFGMISPRIPNASPTSIALSGLTTYTASGVNPTRMSGSPERTAW